MFNYKTAIVTEDNETIKAGDKIKITYYDDSTKEGTFIAVHSLYKNLEMNVIDEGMECGRYNLNILFDHIHKIEKVDNIKVNVKTLLEHYQVLHMMNTKLKFEISKAKKNKDNNKYEELKKLQEQSQYLLTQFEQQDLASNEDINKILECKSILCLDFKVSGLDKEHLDNKYIKVWQGLTREEKHEIIKKLEEE